MKRRLFNFLATILERLSLFFDGRAATQVRIRAVQRASIAPARRISKERAAMSHHCDIPPWHLTNGGRWYCPRCRTWRTYTLLPKVGSERVAEHRVVRYQKHYRKGVMFKEWQDGHSEIYDGHLRLTTGALVNTDKLFAPGR